MIEPDRTAANRLDRAGKRILVADASATYRAVAGRVLADAGYRVEEAADGMAALERLGAGAPVDLLLLDLDLPRLRGLDLIRRVRESTALAGLRLLVVRESPSAHLGRVLGDLKVDASLGKNHALRELLYQVDALLFPAAADERRAPRRLRPLPVNYWVDGNLSLESCFDLSEAGMFIVATDQEPPAVGTVLPLRFWLPTGDRLIACEGEVVWRNAVGGDLRVTHPPGMGVRFRGLGAEERELVREFVRRSS